MARIKFDKKGHFYINGKRPGKSYREGFKLVKKGPSLESIVNAIAGGSAKNKTWRSATGTLTDLAGMFSPSEAQKLRKIAMTGSGLTESKIMELLKQQGLTASKLQRSYEEAVSNQSEAMMLKASSATQKARQEVRRKTREATDYAANKVAKYTSKTSQAVSDLYSGLSGDKDITDKYNSMEKLIKEEE